MRVTVESPLPPPVGRVDSESEILRLENNYVRGTGRLTIRLTPSVAGAAAEAMDYLMEYPYACTEQTLSRFLPSLLFQRLPGHAQASEKTVKQGLNRLYELQHPSGAWGWWEHDSDDSWMTAYAIYGLGVAHSHGFAVRADALKKAAK